MEHPKICGAKYGQVYFMNMTYHSNGAKIFYHKSKLRQEVSPQILMNLGDALIFLRNEYLK